MEKRLREMERDFAVIRKELEHIGRDVSEIKTRQNWAVGILAAVIIGALGKFIVDGGLSAAASMMP